MIRRSRVAPTSADLASDTPGTGRSSTLFDGSSPFRRVIPSPRS